MAKFLHNVDGLSKAMIGEYLGEGCIIPTISHFLSWFPVRDEVNIATMHAFVDMIDLWNTQFIDALRMFL